MALLLTKAGEVESNPDPKTDTNKHTPVIWICDLCHKQIKKQPTSIRCNHTHNTHWVHLNCTQIKQRQYKPDWRCTFPTHTQIVTRTQQPIVDKTQPNQSTKGEKHCHTSNQHKRHQKQNRGTNNLVHSNQPGIITIQETKLTQKAKTPKIIIIMIIIIFI